MITLPDLDVDMNLSGVRKKSCGIACIQLQSSRFTNKPYLFSNMKFSVKLSLFLLYKWSVDSNIKQSNINIYESFKGLKDI